MARSQSSGAAASSPTGLPNGAHLAAAGLSTGEVDQAIALLGMSPDIPVQAEPVLCHGDISPEHVFVDADLRVHGLIDWGLWHGGSAVGDLAHFAMGHDEADVAAVADGHGWSLGDPTFRRAISLAVVALAILDIAWKASIGPEPDTSSLRRALADLA